MANPQVSAVALGITPTLLKISYSRITYPCACADEKWRQTFPWTESIRDTLSRVKHKLTTYLPSSTLSSQAAIMCVPPQVYQFRRFRPMQEEAINAALSGEDVFVLFATGAGKSLCYEVLPPVLLQMR